MRHPALHLVLVVAFSTIACGPDTASKPKVSWLTHPKRSNTSDRRIELATVTPPVRRESASAPVLPPIAAQAPAAPTEAKVESVASTIVAPIDASTEKTAEPSITALAAADDGAANGVAQDQSTPTETSVQVAPSSIADVEAPPVVASIAASIPADVAVTIVEITPIDPVPASTSTSVDTRVELDAKSEPMTEWPANADELAKEAPSTALESTAPVADDSAAVAKTSYGLSGGWGGVRDYLADHGFTVDLSIILEGNHVLSGGVRQQTTAHALYDLTTTFDLDRIAGWKDAQITIEAYATGGHNPSLDVGDAQSFSDISTIDVAQIAQVFYEQWFAARTCRLKFGKMDANSDFAAPANGTESIHSAAAFSPTCFAMVTYPNPATGILAGWVPNEDWSLNLAMYDGAGAAGVNTGSLGPESFFRDPPGYLFLGELGRRWKLGGNDLVGGASIGAWRHTGTFDDFDGGTQDDANGFYGTLDQELSRAAEGESGGTKSIFLQYGSADADVSPYDQHFGVGLHWTGCCCARPEDAIGLYVSRVHFSDGAGTSADNETAYELGYAIHWCAGVVLTPDLQYISNPGGDASLDDAAVFSVRCELSF